jgi:hypothetical protein
MVGEQIAIHQGNKFDTDDVWNILPDLNPEEKVRGGRKGVVAVARILGAVQKADLIGMYLVSGKFPEDWSWEEQRKWYVGPYGWILGEVIPVGPFECSGALSLWRLPEATEAAVRKELAARGSNENTDA